MSLPDRVKEVVYRFLRRRRTAYVQVFCSPVGEEVLSDLARFCRAHDTTMHADPRMHAVLEGRREVFLRIARHINLSDDALWKLYAKDPT